MILSLYRFLWLFLSPIMAVLFIIRLVKGKEDPKRWTERLGVSTVKRPAGDLIWCHGASVGEALSLLPLMIQLKKNNPKVTLLLTTGTRTSAKLVAKQIETNPDLNEVIHQYVPLDMFVCVRAFMQHWRPTVSVFVESEFWPELVSQAVHPVLINGRISDRSFPRYMKFRFFFKGILGRFKQVLAQRDVDAQRMLELGAKQAVAAGNLKFDAPPLGVDEEVLFKLQKKLKSKKVLVAASTHAGEEEQLAKLYKNLASKHKKLMMIIVPRHPERGEAVARMLSVPRRSVGDDVPTEGIYVADTLGELGLWYRLADVCVIGGSLIAHGGHNPLESLKLGVPTLTGPHMFNFKDMLPVLLERNLMTIAPDLKSLQTEVDAALKNEDNTKQDVIAALEQLHGATEQAAKLIKQELKYAKMVENPNCL